MVRDILLNTILVFGFISNTSTDGQARSCEQLISDISAAKQSFNIETLQANMAEAKVQESDCTSEQLFCIGRRASRLIINEVFTRSSTGVSDSALKPLLEIAYEVGPTWKAAFYLAEAEEDGDKTDQTRFDRSAKYFQLAINHIDQICGDAKFVPSTAHASLKHVSYAEILRNLAHLYGFALVRKCRVARDHEDT